MEAKKTALFDIHCRFGGKMVDFAGFKMPIQYTGILEEHQRVRSTVGVFDVSHMGEIVIQGKNALEMVNYITVNNVEKIDVNQAQYTAMCYPDGGIVDDLIVYNRGDHYLLVVNAANMKKDLEWILSHQQEDVIIKDISDTITQLAVQGKTAEVALQKLTNTDLSKIQYYCFQDTDLAGVSTLVSRTGYTGEPGFELYFDEKESEKIWNAIFEAGKEFDIAPIGLGARDSLRLEKKYCLYGNDIDKNTNPYEAGLGWIVKLKKGDFIGREALIKIKEEGIQRKLAGFEVKGRMIPRHGYSIMKNNQEIGYVTSGCYSPTLKKNIGLAYITKEFSETGTEIELKTASRSIPAEIVKTPFL